MVEENDKVYCSDGTRCGGKEWTYKRLIGKGNRFVCFECQGIEYGIDIIDFLKSKMGDVRKAEGDEYRFAVRELVQNADDAEAKIITIRVDDDALYAANDGYPFRPSDDKTGWEGDYRRICRVLSGAKAKDPNTAGAHGSGFQSVYCFTNHPDIHSSGISARLDPTKPSAEGRIIKLEQKNQAKSRSPYSPCGVLFSFPWRDERAANKEYGGRRPFVEEQWPRWNKKTRERLVKDLIPYLPDLVLCCQHIEVIRLIWGERPEAYQVQRIGFHLGDAPDDFYLARVEEGPIEVPKDWEGSFLLNKWKWCEKKSPEGGWEYLVGSTHVTNERGARLYYGYSKKGIEILTTSLDELAEDKQSPDGKKHKLKSNVHVLLPLFDTSKRPEKRYYMYSVLPIPYLGENRFACTTHLIVHEDRSSLRMEPKETLGWWFIRAMASLSSLYLKLFKAYLKRIFEMRISEEEKQGLILNNVPGGPLCKWIDPVGGMSDELGDEQYELKRRLVDMGLLYSRGLPISPLKAYWVEEPKQQWLVARLGVHVLSDAFKGHEMFKTLNSELENRKFQPDDFLTIWGGFSAGNVVEDGILKLGQKLADGSVLDKELINALIEFCLTSSSSKIRDIWVIPDSNGILNQKNNFPYIPEGYESLIPLLSNDKRIHDDFRDLVRRLDERQGGVNDVIRTLSDAINSQKERFKHVSQKDHHSLVEIVAKVVRDRNFAIEDVKAQTFIPYEYQESVHVGEPNKDDKGELLETEHAGEYYLQNHIFKTQRRKVPGLTPEIQRGIKILSLLGVDEMEAEKIEKKLGLVALLEKGVPGPTNFVRVYISPKHGSLFEDEHLKNFLSDSCKVQPTKEVVVRQKRAMLEAVRFYFKRGKRTELGLRPEDMKKVPCLYDQDGVWHPAGEFAINITEELSMLRKHQLHQDFMGWEKDTLVGGLGVCESPNEEDVVSAIVDLTSGEKQKVRKEMKKILNYLLTSDIEGISLKRMKEINDREWIPTIDGGFKLPRMSLLPIKDNIDIMGPTYGAHVELPQDIADKSQDKINERAVKIGIRITPETEEMLDLVEKLYKEKGRPPSRLFDELSKVDTNRVQQWKGRTLAYYDEMGVRWIQADKVRLMKEAEVPPQLRRGYLFMPLGHRHEKYLRTYLAAKDCIHADEILEYMVGGKAEIDTRLWSFLSMAPKNEAPLSKYGNKPIFPNPYNQSHMLAPDKIILRENETFREEGQWGSWFILDCHDEYMVKMLKLLGAKVEKDLTLELIKSVLKSMAWDGAIPYEDCLYTRMMRLLGRLADMPGGTDTRLDERCMPVRTLRDTMSCKKIRDCYLNDHFKAKWFRGDLPILEETVDGVYNQNLYELYHKNGCKSFKENVRIMPNRIPPSGGERDRKQETRFSELRKALSAHKKELRKSIEWLDECKVFRYDDIQGKYEVGGVSRPTSGYDIQRDGATIIINIAKFAPQTIEDELPVDVYYVCEGMGNLSLPTETVNSITAVIKKFLFRNLGDLAQIVPGYALTGESPPPLVEILEGSTTEGYLQTRAAFMNWYNACQICFTRTPADTSGDESCETVTSVVSMRGGRYRGHFNKYSIDNCLFLCPTHQKLYERGLIKMLYLESASCEASEEAKKGLGRKIAELKPKIFGRKKATGKELLLCEVFQTPVTDDFQKSEGKWCWEEMPIYFNAEHLYGLLQWFDKYLEGEGRDSG